MRKAIQKTTQQATRQPTHDRTWKAAQLKEKEVTITFGTLTFSITRQEANIQTGNFKFTNSSTKDTTDRFFTHECSLPAAPKSNLKQKQTVKRQQEKNPANRPSTGPRFIKIPQATKEWQQVTRKPKQNKNKKNNIQCFHCHKRGHIQRFCWQKINCYNCRKKGHKASNCFLKAPGNSLDPNKSAPKHINKKNQQTRKQTTNLIMEPIHGRPPMGDMFFPTRITLNEDNDYLSNVGLIILIRGSPSPDLPRLIADKLVEVNGGHPNDFMVTQATISPYLVTCSNSHLRDTIVRRGIYTIPQTRVKFTIHEWRPRFGMGFDPPTHQAWVRIIGLPLQAWTTPEITAILRRFGHPMQILPFGQEAGHFRDITALIATKNLSQIPLVYTYREGDYATKIDILILSTRTWDESFPPPPEDNNSPHFSQSPSQNHAGPSNPQPRSPFSSPSSEAPTEPTVDLSAWSPRSRKFISFNSHIWDFQPNQSDHCSLWQEQLAMLTNLSKETPFFFSSDSQYKMVLHIQDRGHVSVTKNPNLLKAPTQFSSILYTHLTTVHNPITINPLRSLRTINSTTLSLGEIQNILNLRCTISLTRSQIGRESTRVNLEVTPTDLILSFDDEVCSKGELNVVSALTGLRDNEVSLTRPPSSPNYSLNLAQTQLPLCFSDQAQSPTQPSIDTSLENQFTSIQTQQQQSQFPTDESVELHGYNSILGNIDLPTQTTTEHADAQCRQSKQTALPTRRSQRILEKRSTLGAQQNKKKRTKTQASMIQFDKDSLQTPLDTSKALQILQSTGLTINKQIEDLIEEAVKQDQEMGNADQPTPTTPLHDPIPPFAIPGTDLLL